MGWPQHLSDPPLLRRHRRVLDSHLDWTARGRGIGRQLLAALVDTARGRGYWKLVSRVFPANAASRALCGACGFREVGSDEKHAQLDGQWMDVIIVERMIPENMDLSGSRHID